MSNTDAPPAPAAAEPETPAAPPAPEPAAVQLVVEPAAEPDEPRRTRRRGGVPIEPLVIGVVNGTATATTAAYQAGGPYGLAAAAGTAVVLAAGGALQRRRTVRSRTTTAAGRYRGGAGSSTRGRSGGGALRTGSGRGALGGGGSNRRGGALGAGSAGRGGSTPRTRRGALGSLGALGGRGGGAAGRLNTPRHNDPKRKRKRRRKDDQRTSPSTRTRTPRNRSRLGMLRPAASAARRGMANTGRALRSTGRGVARTARGIGHMGRFAAAPARALWRRTEAARRAAARRVVRAAGAVWDSALAGLAGLTAALWQRSWRGGLATLRAVWQRRRRTRAARQAANGPAMTGPTIASAPAPIAPYVRRPTTVGGSPSNTGGRMTGGHHFLAPAMEMERIATTYTPDGMMQVGRDFASLPDALEHVANSIKISTARADAEQPLDPRIVDIMQQIYLLEMKAAQLARDLAPAFRKLHDLDIARLQAPRKGRQGESQWDVRANADASL